MCTRVLSDDSQLLQVYGSLRSPFAVPGVPVPFSAAITVLHVTLEPFTVRRPRPLQRGTLTTTAIYCIDCGKLVVHATLDLSLRDLGDSCSVCTFPAESLAFMSYAKQLAPPSRITSRDDWPCHACISLVVNGRRSWGPQSHQVQLHDQAFHTLISPLTFATCSLAPAVSAPHLLLTYGVGAKPSTVGLPTRAARKARTRKEQRATAAQVVFHSRVSLQVLG